MASTSVLYLTASPIPRTNYRPRRHTNVTTTTTFARRREVHGHNFGKRNIVDENMIVLRKRIREVERDDNDDDDGNNEPPAEWMGWEKDIYPSYGHDHMRRYEIVAIIFDGDEAILCIRHAWTHSIECPHFKCSCFIQSAGIV